MLAITPQQWLMLTVGLLVGGTVWVCFNRRIVGRLKERTVTGHAIAVVEGVIGGIVYLATLVASFFLLSFPVAGMLVGAWITIPASFE